MAGPIDDFLKTAAYWYERAEEARLQAETVKDPTAKAALHSIANTYERLGQFAHARKAGDSRP